MSPYDDLRTVLRALRHAKNMRDGSDWREEEYGVLVDAFNAMREDYLEAISDSNTGGG